MGKIRSSLVSILNNEDMNSTYYKIAKYLLQNNYISNHVTMDDVAKNCFCAKSTVSRFCRQIGYENYYELNLDLYNSTRLSQDKYNRYFEYDFDTTKEIFLGNMLNLIEMMYKSICENDIHNFVADLLNYEEVAIFGNSQSQAMAQTFQNDMCLSRKIITASQLPEHQKQYIINANENHLIIIISFSGEYFRSFINDHVFNKKSKPKIVLITCNPKMQNSQHYDHIYYIEAQDTYAYRAHCINIFLNIVSIEYAKAFSNKYL